MSAIKSIIIIFDRDVELSELTKDLTEISKSGFFGLTGKYFEYYYEPLNYDVSIPLGFIKLNGKEYTLDAKYYPENNLNSIRLASFSNDWSGFQEDLIDEINKPLDQKSQNVKKLISLLKSKLGYYSMVLFTYDYFTDCPDNDQLIKMQLDGSLNDMTEKCYIILDSNPLIGTSM